MSDAPEQPAVSPDHPKKGSIRIAANYLRLVLGLGLGLIWARLLLGSLGDEGFGLIMLLGSTAGFGMIIQQAMQGALIREVGAVYHSDDDVSFGRAYSGAWLLAMLVAGATLLAFVGLYFLLPLLEIPSDLLAPARWLLIAVALESVMFVVMTVPLNMLLITERFAAHNAIMLLIKVANFAAAVVAERMVARGVSPGEGLVWYGFFNAGLMVLVRFGGVVWARAVGIRVLPWSRTDRASIAAIAGTGGWNLAVTISLNLHIRADALLMNLFFGLQGNTVFGLGVQAAGMIRQLATGMTDGLDAVATRVTTRKGHGGLRMLIERTGRLQGLVVFPAIVGAAVLFEPLVRIWLGPRLDKIDEPRQLTIVSWILLIGFGARAISDGWRRVFYGAGHIAKFAPLLLVGGVVNPVVGVALSKALPESFAWTGPALAFAGSMLLFNGVLMVLRSESAASLPLWSSFASLTRPLAATLLATPAIFVPLLLEHPHDLTAVLAGGVPFCAAYAVCAWLIVLTPEERGRMLKALRLGRGRTASEPRG